MLTVVSIVIGASIVSIVTMWIYDMQQSGIKPNSSPLSEVWFLTFVYELMANGIISNLWGTLVYALVFFSGFLSLVSFSCLSLTTFYFLTTFCILYIPVYRILFMHLIVILILLKVLNCELLLLYR